MSSSHLTSQVPLEVGTDIYYTGDAANVAGFGYVGRAEQTRWGFDITLQLHDGRRFVVSPSAFLPGPGRRFMTKADYDVDRAAKIAAINSAAERGR